MHSGRRLSKIPGKGSGKPTIGCAMKAKNGTTKKCIGYIRV
jgi:hypothetical protein